VRVKPEQFAAEAKKYFAFLADEGFVGPSGDDDLLLYSDGRFGVYVVYDARDGRVTTVIEASVGQRNVHASLSCLYVESGLGPAQRIRDIARSSHSLEKALASQASALRVLLPVLERPHAASVLLECHGR
jgi:hypothetical protein